MRLSIRLTDYGLALEYVKYILHTTHLCGTKRLIKIINALLYGGKSPVAA